LIICRSIFFPSCLGREEREREREKERKERGRVRVRERKKEREREKKIETQNQLYFIFSIFFDAVRKFSLPLHTHRMSKMFRSLSEGNESEFAKTLRKKLVHNILLQD
jgi:hypothetical protein